MLLCISTPHIHLRWADLFVFNAVLHDLSQLLNTGLDKNQLKACVELIENGINAGAVAVSILDSHVEVFHIVIWRGTHSLFRPQTIVTNLREVAAKEENNKATKKLWRWTPRPTICQVICSHYAVRRKTVALCTAKTLDTAAEHGQTRTSSTIGRSTSLTSLRDHTKHEW